MSKPVEMRGASFIKVALSFVKWVRRGIADQVILTWSCRPSHEYGWPLAALRFARRLLDLRRASIECGVHPCTDSNYLGRASRTFGSARPSFLLPAVGTMARSVRGSLDLSRLSPALEQAARNAARGLCRPGESTTAS